MRKNSTTSITVAGVQTQRRPFFSCVTLVVIFTARLLCSAFAEICVVVVLLSQGLLWVLVAAVVAGESCYAKYTTVVMGKAASRYLLLAPNFGLPYLVVPLWLRILLLAGKRLFQG